MSPLHVAVDKSLRRKKKKFLAPIEEGAKKIVKKTQALRETPCTTSRNRSGGGASLGSLSGRGIGSQRREVYTLPGSGGMVDRPVRGQHEEDLDD